MNVATDNTDRHCSRCGLPLTDVASRESGQGPVCRQKNTHLFAKTIPANYAMVTALALGMTSDWFHEETGKTWNSVQKSLRKIAAKACEASEDPTCFVVRGADLRAVVQKLDFMCSYRHPHASARRNLVELVRQLGYVGLAGVLSGEASTSKSRLWFDQGRVHMTGLNNRSGWSAMGKVPGIVRPLRGRKDPYSAPAAQAEAFVAVVRQYWPMFDENAEDVIKSASSWASTNPGVAQASSASTQSVPRFLAEVRSADFTCSFPWVRNGNMGAFLTNLKTIPASGRSYDPNTRKWSFRTEHLETVLGMARASGLFGIVDSMTTSATTPEGIYRSAEQRQQAARARGRNSTWFSTRGRWIR